MAKFLMGGYDLTGMNLFGYECCCGKCCPDGTHGPYGPNTWLLAITMLEPPALPGSIFAYCTGWCGNVTNNYTLTKNTPVSLCKWTYEANIFPSGCLLHITL